MTEYTPTTEEVRDRFIDGFPIDTWVVARDSLGEEFDRWLAERDRQVAQRAWGEGFEAGWAECNDPGPFVNDVWDAKTPNPHRKEATGD